jgi:hypothetical protein
MQNSRIFRNLMTLFHRHIFSAAPTVSFDWIFLQLLQFVVLPSTAFSGAIFTVPHGWSLTDQPTSSFSQQQLTGYDSFQYLIGYYRKGGERSVMSHTQTYIIRGLMSTSRKMLGMLIAIVNHHSHEHQYIACAPRAISCFKLWCIIVCWWLKIKNLKIPCQCNSCTAFLYTILQQS